MFDAILKSKFYSRCKSEMKVTLKRIEMIRRKRIAMLNFLKNDVSQLLQTGLDSNAFDRVGQLYGDQNLTWCYEFVERSCLFILSQLSAMNKQRECPEDCKEHIATLMFAAARFADLPELRELRSLFVERYGNYLEPYVNQEFVKNLKADPPTKQRKLQMMQEIALEKNINWDSRALEQKLYIPPPIVQDRSQYTNGNSLPYRSRAEIETKMEEKHDHDRLSPCWSSNTSSSSESATSADDSASEDTPQGRKFYELKSMAPPYIKESTKKSTVSNNNISGLRSMGPPYIKPDLSKTTAGSNVNVNVNVDKFKSQEEIEDVGKPVARSMRIRRPLKQTAGSSNGNNDGSKASYKFSNGENNFVDHDYRDEEEKKMDKLLSQYSRKPSHLPAPKRIGSLPSEPVAGGGAVDERKGLSRAATYQPGSGLGQLGHVHPKLPDYDDFVARLAAYRASS